jgi:YVTN family beta-propeller protein
MFARANWPLDKLSRQRLGGVVLGGKLGLAMSLLIVTFAQSIPVGSANVTSEAVTLHKPDTFAMPGVVEVVSQTISTDRDPYLLAFDGTNVWATHQFSQTVTVWEADSGASLGKHPTGSQPTGIAWAGSRMWISNSGGGNVTVLNANGSFAQAIPVGLSPIGIAYDGSQVWVANWQNGLGNTLSVLDASTGQHVMTPTVGGGPFGLAFDGTHIWATNATSGTVSVLQTDGTHVMTPTVGPLPLQLAFDGDLMWVSNNEADYVTALDAITGAQVMTVTVGTKPWGMAFDGRNIWVGNNEDDTVSIIRAADGVVIATVPVGDKPQGLVFDGVSMWVANHGSHSLTKLSLVKQPWLFLPVILID